MLLSAPKTLHRPWGSAALPARRAPTATRADAGAGGGPEGGGSGGSGAAADAVLARIKAAQKYKAGQVTTQTAAATQPAAGVGPLGSAPSSSSSGVGGVGGSSSVGAAASPPATSSQASEGSSSATGPEAVLARIKKAREYQAQAAGGPSEQPPQQPGGGGEGGGSGTAAEAQRQSEQQQQWWEQGQAMALRAEDSAGTAQQAAGWLQSVVNKEQPQADPSLSPEMFTLLREEEMKRRGGEVIVGSFKPITRKDRMDSPLLEASGAAGTAAASQSAAAPAAVAGAGVQEAAPLQPPQQQQEEGEEDGPRYKPKVQTWGVFPRPQNISQAYGGGRNLKPGQALESEEEAKAREARVNAALKRYRKTLGMDVNPQDEAKAAALCEQGNAYFKQGSISLALDKYAAAAELVPARSKVGGEAYLQWALCLDSLGRNQEAYEIYKKVKGHPTAAVAKQAARMLFGFKAAQDLKASSFSYAPTTQAWKNYFDRISRAGSWNTSYYSASSSAGEEEGSEAWVTAVAVGVMLAPLGLVAYRVLLMQQQ